MVLSGGLGNQIFQYIAGRAIFNQSTIILDYSLLNPKLLKNGLPEISDLKLCKNVTFECPRRLRLTKRLAEFALKGSSIRQDRSIRRQVLVKMFPAFCFIAGFFFFNRSKIVSPRGIGSSKISINRFKSNLLIGNFHSYSWFERNAIQFKDELSLKSGVEMIEPFRSASSIERPLVVQMRFGDFLGIAELNVITPEYFANSLSLTRARFPNSKVWIFSNDYEKARQFLGDLYSDEFKEINPDDFSSAQILELLKLGANYIISNSTFGWWGAYLSQNTHPIICVPSKWYATMLTPKELIPVSWERVPLCRIEEN